MRDRPPSHSATGRLRSLRSRMATLHSLHPTIALAAIAAALSAWVYWSLLFHLRSATPADPDSALFVWSMAHAPRQLLHGNNPFFSNAIFAVGGGANLAYNATAPLLGLVMYPFTAWLGPVAGFNLLVALTPVANTLAARRSLRVLTGRSGFSVSLGALVLGFSPMVMMHNGARMQLVFQAVALLLLAELFVLGRAALEGAPMSRRRAVAAGALAGLQMWIGSEQLAIVMIVVAVTLLVVLTLARFTASLPARSTLRWHRRDLGSLALGFAAMLLVAAPFLAEFLFGSQRYTDGYHVAARPLFGLRIANLVTPTEATLFRTHIPLAIDRVQMSVFRDEDTGYLGLLALGCVLVTLATWRRRNTLQRAALLVGLGCFVLALGPTIRWSGTGSGLPGPWRLLEHLPVLREIVANRMSLGLFLMLGVLVATVGQSAMAAEPPRQRGAERSFRTLCWCAPLLLLPAQFHHTKAVAASAAELLKQRCNNTLVVTTPQPLEQEGMAWQARSDFAFDLYRGFAFRSSTLPKGDRLLIDDIAERGSGDDAAITAATAQLSSLGIGCVVTPSKSLDVADNLAPVLGPPLVAGDVAVWALR